MRDPNEPIVPSWSTTRSAKDRNAVLRSVTALLDELAPERVLTRAEHRARVEQHRTPNGCVLQAAGSAVSVSWFEEARDGTDLGELHVVVWRGIVSRRGSPPRREGATQVKELVLYPIEKPTTDKVWRSSDGTLYDTATLAAR